MNIIHILMPWTTVFDRSLKRVPGQTLKMEIDEIGGEIALAYGATALLFPVTIVALFYDSAETAFVAMTAALMCLALFLLRLRKIIPKLKGFRAERKVGDNLDLLAYSNARILHDIQCVGAGGARFNIDHVVLHPSGIYAIETKFIMRKKGAHGIVDVQSDNIYVDGKPSKKNPINQATANAAHLSNVLFSNNQKRNWIDAVVIVEGFKFRGTSKKALVTDVTSFREHVMSRPPHKYEAAEIKKLYETLRAYSEANTK